MTRQRRGNKAREPDGARAKWLGLDEDFRRLLDHWFPGLEVRGSFSSTGEEERRELAISLTPTLSCLLTLFSPALISLSPREKAVADLAQAGYSNKEIAAKLNIAVQTVGTHLKRAYAKLGVHSRHRLAHQCQLPS